MADEPTGSLDDQNTNIVMDFIIDLSKKKNILTIFATHNLNLIKKLDKSFKINRGKLVKFENK